jgi:hypothetical protein
MVRTLRGSLGVLAAVALASCVSAKRPVEQPTSTAHMPGASLWHEPVDLGTRDLFYGPWGREHAPLPAVTYTLVAHKHTGVNLGMSVTDPEGREWSVKQTSPGGLDNEGAVEVAVSRLLSAVGYHQPPVYYLPAFTLKDDWGTHVEIGGRFRLKMPALTETTDWKWENNPFVATRAHQGLLVLLMMCNSTDLKATNNSIFEYKNGDHVEQRFVVRDIGAALGDLDRFAPFKGNPDAFERQPFILGVSNGHVEFAYNGMYSNYVRDRITPEDVAWASALLSQLSDRQWDDAFRAAGYSPGDADRFIKKLKEKVAQGRSLPLSAAIQ